MEKILIIDDNDNWRETTSLILQKQGYYVDQAGDGTTGIEMVRDEGFDLVFTDLKMGEISGLDVIKEIKAQNESIEVILITAFASVDTAVEAMKSGAYDYITKDTRKKELLMLLERALEKKKLVDRVKNYEKELKLKYSFDEIIGSSAEMLNVLDTVTRVCKTDSTILISGSSGTGKELIGRAIHYNSDRSDKPVVIVNCGAIPENLQESEMFGHKKGAFTGAISDKKGLFEEANTGTLILDEVGELSPASQVKLLRFLQNKEIIRVGETHKRILDVRIIAMTNRDLKTEIKENNFREDLYYRLNVIPIFIPPLRDRKDDIEPLVNHFIETFKAKLHKPGLEITRRAMNIMKQYKWPGNVRELENTIERCAILCEEDLITPEDLPFETDDQSRGGLGNILSKEITLEEVEKIFIKKTLQRFEGNRSRAAEALGINRNTLANKIKLYRL